MQAIIFMGIQASGKSTFYLKHFFHTHVRISLDLLRTHHRERVFLNTCLETLQSFVVDKTNATVEERRKYIELAKRYQYEVIGYYFLPDVEGAVQRNVLRPQKQVVPEIAIYGTRKKLEVPTYEEGFDRLYQVRLLDHHFLVNEIEHAES